MTKKMKDSSMNADKINAVEIETSFLFRKTSLAFDITASKT